MVHLKTCSVALIALLAVSIVSHAGEPVASKGESPADDSRRLVSMPAAAQGLLRKDMIDHLQVLNQLFAHLAASEYRKASELAEARLGRSSMGRHRGTGMGPGRFMPPEMHQLGMGMHEAASEFARIVPDQDSSTAYAALQRVTSFCVACHLGFRVR
jgi:hypothetical protein